MNAWRTSLYALIMALMIVVSGCTPSVAPTLPPPLPSTTAPTTTPSPQPTGPRYDALPIRFCETLDWEAISEQLHLSVTETRFVDWFDFDSSRSDSEPSWWAQCEVDGLTEDGTFHPTVSMGIDIFELSGEARQKYENWVSTYRDDFGYEWAAIEGWWDQGVRFVSYRPSGGRHWAIVIHQVRHHNLYLETSISGGFGVEGATEEDFFALVDDLSLGLVEAVAAYLPCRASPEATPVPVCH